VRVTGSSHFWGVLPRRLHFPRVPLLSACPGCPQAAHQATAIPSQTLGLRSGFGGCPRIARYVGERDIRMHGIQSTERRSCSVVYALCSSRFPRCHCSTGRPSIPAMVRLVWVGTPLPQLCISHLSSLALSVWLMACCCARALRSSLATPGEGVGGAPVSQSVAALRRCDVHLSSCQSALPHAPLILVYLSPRA